MSNAALNILSVQSSANRDASTTRALSAKFLANLQTTGANAMIVSRDLADGAPFVDQEWVGANFTEKTERSGDQAAALTFSDSLVEELRDADIILIGAPIYNFSIPAALKAWIDQVARVGETFRYTDNGPVGLLEGKRAIIVMASGGTKIGSDIDFASGYLRHVLGFMGITDVEIVTADSQSAGATEATANAESALTEIANEIAKTAKRI